MISFFIPGLPQPAGSKRGFAIKKGGQYTGRVAIVDANKKSRDWKTDIKIAAEHVAPQTLLTGPVHLTLDFHLPRPKGHYGSGKNSAALKDSAPARPTTKPDLLKLARAVEDALTDVIWQDDAQIVTEILNKFYTDDRPGVAIEVRELKATLVRW